MIVYKFHEDVSKAKEDEELDAPPALGLLVGTVAVVVIGARTTGGVNCGTSLVKLFGKQNCALLPLCWEAQMSFRIDMK